MCDLHSKLKEKIDFIKRLVKMEMYFLLLIQVHRYPEFREKRVPLTLGWESLILFLYRVKTSRRVSFNLAAHEIPQNYADQSCWENRQLWRNIAEETAWSGTNYKGFLEKASPFQTLKEMHPHWGRWLAEIHKPQLTPHVKVRSGHTRIKYN